MFSEDHSCVINLGINQAQRLNQAPPGHRLRDGPGGSKIKTVWTHRIEEECLEELPVKKFESISCHCLHLFSIMAVALFYQCRKAFGMSHESLKMKSSMGQHHLDSLRFLSSLPPDKKSPHHLIFVVIPKRELKEKHFRWRDGLKTIF